MNAAFQLLYSRVAPALARRGRPPETPDPDAIAGFRRAQRLAYDCVVAVAARLAPGVTERAAARLCAADLHARGVRTYLHRPFAWFGDHSRFDGYRDFHDFHPGDRRLEDGAPYILDVSPIVDGFMADIGYTVTPRDHAAELDAKRFLVELRGAIPEMFAASPSLADVWHEVDRRVRAAGFLSCHARYPLRVLGHRVYRIAPRWARLRLPRLPVRLLGLDWFSPQGLVGFGRGLVAADLLTPENRDGDRRGFWAIEPHVGGAGFGAKFEEILAFDGERAAWVDDAPPHVAEARRRGWLAAVAA